MTSRSRAPRSRDRSLLESPWLAALLAVVVIGLAAAILLPSLLGIGGPAATATLDAGLRSPTPPPAAPTFLRPTPSPAPTFVAYLVKSGDTLNSIAKQFDTTARSIAWWSRGSHPTLDPESPKYQPNRLEIGWVLQVLPGSVVDENNPPTPSPGALPRPEPTRSPAATSAPMPAPTAAAALANVVTHGPRTAANIALTFDMGGRVDPAVEIVQWLLDHEVHATLFPTGVMATQTAQGYAALQLAATRPDLFDIGNHSWDHPDFRELSASEMAAQLKRAESALLPIAGTSMPWFRPPFGSWNDAVRRGVRAGGWPTMVMWDIDTIDWRPVDNGSGTPGPTASEIVDKVRANARGGSIVLLHLGGWNTPEALPGILEACSDLRLEPVMLTEMLGS